MNYEKPFVTTRFRLTRGQTIHRTAFPEGQVIAEIRHHPDIPVQHIIEACRSGIVDKRVVVLEEAVQQIPGLIDPQEQTSKARKPAVVGR